MSGTDWVAAAGLVVGALGVLVGLLTLRCRRCGAWVPLSLHRYDCPWWSEFRAGRRGYFS